MKAVLKILFCLFMANGILLSGFSATDDSLIMDTYKKAKMVFTGKVTSVRELTADSIPENNAPSMIVEFTVTEIQKGVRRAQVLIVTPPVSSSDDLFEKGKEYLVYIIKQPGVYGLHQFTNIRKKKVVVGEENPEVKVIYNFLKNHPFRSVKSPVSPYDIGKGCGC